MIIESQFKAAWWLSNPHLQTVWPTLFRRKPHLKLKRERLELPDGDFIDIDWTAAAAGPLVAVFHGLEGSSQSIYAAGLLHCLQSCGYQAVFMHFRGCSGECNRLPRGYHAGDTGDIDYFIEVLRSRFPHRQLAAVGFSLGGNALLKWLGETGKNNPLACAGAVSVPLELDICAERIDTGLSRVYQRYLLRKMHRSARRKLGKNGYPLHATTLAGLASIRSFDDHVTAPLHGFSGVDDYYQRSSSRAYLQHIRTPTLIVHAKDDPFMRPTMIPETHELAPAVTLEVSEQGGHVGFIAGWGRYWLEERISGWLQEQLE